MALHLVTDGGKHYWIEPKSPAPLGSRLTDDEPLRVVYAQDSFGGQDNFEVLRDDNIFNSVLVSAGWFGIVYSIVIAAVRQVLLYQERRLRTWRNISKICPVSLLLLGSGRMLDQLASRSSEGRNAPARFATGVGRTRSHSDWSLPAYSHYSGLYGPDS